MPPVSNDSNCDTMEDPIVTFIENIMENRFKFRSRCSRNYTIHRINWFRSLTRLISAYICEHIFRIWSAE